MNDDNNNNKIIKQNGLISLESEKFKRLTHLGLFMEDSFQFNQFLNSIYRRKDDKLQRLYDHLRKEPPQHLVDRKNKLLKEIKKFNADCARIGREDLSKTGIVDEITRCIPKQHRMTSKLKPPYDGKISVYKDESPQLVFVEEPKPYLIHTKKSGEAQFYPLDGRENETQQADLMEMLQRSGIRRLYHFSQKKMWWQNMKIVIGKLNQYD